MYWLFRGGQKFDASVLGFEVGAVLGVHGRRKDLDLQGCETETRQYFHDIKEVCGDPIDTTLYSLQLPRSTLVEITGKPTSSTPRFQAPPRSYVRHLLRKCLSGHLSVTLVTHAHTLEYALSYTTKRCLYFLEAKFVIPQFMGLPRISVFKSPFPPATATI